MFRTYKTTGLAIFATLLLSACQTTGSSLESKPSTAEMPPVAERRAVMGDQWTWLNEKDEELSGNYTSIDADFAAGENSIGCSWKAKRNAFAPGVEWKNCRGSTGTQTSKRVGDSIFPLAVGKTETWEYSGTNNKGDSWESTRNCKVVGIANVTVPMGNYDTYHVRCEDKWWVREWFVRADGVSVQGSSTRKAGSADRNSSWRLISFTPAT